MPPAEVEVVGSPIPAQIAPLKRSRRLRYDETLVRIGVKLVRWHGEEWLGFPTIAAGSWKLWGLNGNGEPRIDDAGKLIRRNVGPVSIIVSPAPRESAPGSVPKVLDVEGECVARTAQ